MNRLHMSPIKESNTSKSEKIWKGSVAAYSEALSRDLPKWGKPRIVSVRIAGLRAKHFVFFLFYLHSIS
jgi:hypothetical protein